MNNFFNIFHFDENVDIHVDVNDFDTFYNELKNKQNVGKTHISKKSIENRSKIGRQRLDELKLDAVDVEFIEI